MIDHKTFREALNDTLDYLYEWEKESRIDFEFAALQQWDKDDTKRLEQQGRPALVFDRTRPIIASVSGAEITNRYEPKFLPRDADLSDVDVPFSEAANKVYGWIRDRGEFEHHESAAFQSCIICGIGATEMYMDYEFDSDGVVRLSRIPIWELGWDPASVEPNLRDARYVIRDRWIDEDEIISRFGRDLVSDVKRLGSVDDSPGRSRGFLSNLFTKEVDDPRDQYFSEKSKKYFDPRMKRIRLWEMLRKERTYKTRLFRPEFMGGGEDFIEPGQTHEVVQQLEALRVQHNFDVQMQNDQAQAIAQMQGQQSMMPTQPLQEEPPINYVEDFPVTKIWRSYHAGNEVVKEDELPLRNFPYQFITGFEDFKDPSKRYFFGLMRTMRDPQKYANKFFSHAVHMWASNPKGAILYEQDLFTNPNKAKEEWAKSTGMIEVEPGRLQSPKPKYEIIPNGASMHGIESLLSHAISSVSAAAGVSEEYTVGMPGDLRRTAASAVQSIKESNLVTISQPFDALRLYKKSQGRLVLDFIAQFVQEKQLVRLLGPEEGEFIPALRSEELAQQYEVIAEEAPASQNKQMEVFSKMMETSFIPQLLDAGVPIPPEVAKYFPFPSDINSQFQSVLSSSKDMVDMQNQLQMMQMKMETMMMEQEMAQAQQMTAQGDQQIAQTDQDMQAQAQAQQMGQLPPEEAV